MTLVRKTTIMALLGAAGAALGAAAGEGLFRARPAEPPEPTPRSICLLFDVSGSMEKEIDLRGTTQLEALKEAAAAFVERQDLETDGLGLVVFATKPRIISILTHDGPALVRAIHRLPAAGTTDLAGGLREAGKVLRHAPGEHWVLLFSDGKPEGLGIDGDPEALARAEASKLRLDGVRIVAIGTGLADEFLLEQIAGRPENVIISDPTALARAFARSEAVIRNRQMLAVGPDGSSFLDSVARAAAWACLIAIGAGLALVAGQNRHMRRRLMSIGELFIVLGGGLFTGALAGASGQSLFYVLSDMPVLGGGGGRVAAWVVLGCGVGLGMSSFVPNLNRRRAATAGTVGGAVAAVVFLAGIKTAAGMVVLEPALLESIGRVLAAAVLGLATGATLVLMEITYRKAWLNVHWGRAETSTLLLGSKPIIIGHASDAHICPEYDEHGPPILARITLDDGNVVLSNARDSERRTLADGQRLEFGPIVIEVRTADVKDPDAVPPGMVPPPPAATPKKVKPAKSGSGTWYRN